MRARTLIPGLLVALTACGDSTEPAPLELTPEEAAAALELPVLAGPRRFSAPGPARPAARPGGGLVSLHACLSGGGGRAQLFGSTIIP